MWGLLLQVRPAGAELLPQNPTAWIKVVGKPYFRYLLERKPYKTLQNPTVLPYKTLRFCLKMWGLLLYGSASWAPNYYCKNPTAFMFIKGTIYLGPQIFFS